jgi:hypothetical protein
VWICFDQPASDRQILSLYHVRSLLT